MSSSRITMDSRQLKLVASCFFLLLSGATSIGHTFSVILSLSFFLLLKISPFNEEWTKIGYDEARKLKKEYEMMFFIFIGIATTLWLLTTHLQYLKKFLPILSIFFR